MDRETFEVVARESLTEVLDELGYPRYQHPKVCGWLAWPEYQPSDLEPKEWCAELGDGRKDARESLLRICIPVDTTVEDAKRTIKSLIHEHGLVPPSHLAYEPRHQGDPASQAEQLRGRLQSWKQELEEVITFYRDDNEARGRLAFNRWKERFTAFLKKDVPSEAWRFESITFHIAWVVKPHEHAYERFMREDGERCLAFIDDLAEAALRGRITELEEGSTPSGLQLTLPSVFLSYAHEDSEPAQRLYTDLKKSGANVWFDRECLLPGQKWKATIKQAIVDSRFFIALLSVNSVNKKGYVQKELKDALEILDEYPDSAIFLIPVRLDTSRPLDRRLHDLQWVDMFPDWSDGLRRILRVLESFQ